MYVDIYICVFVERTRERVRDVYIYTERETDRDEQTARQTDRKAERNKTKQHNTYRTMRRGSMSPFQYLHLSLIYIHGQISKLTG